MSYTLEDLFHSINDIYYQLDEGKMKLNKANFLAKKCCYEFIRQLDELEKIGEIYD
jgi:hypothetical protein